MRKSLKILHLESLAADSDLAQQTLLAAGVCAQFLTVDNKEGYVSALKSFVPDIVLSDHTLPDITASEALDILGIGSKKIPFIILTQGVSETYAVTMMKAGAGDYLLKSDLSALGAAVLQALDRSMVQTQYEQSVDEIMANEALMKEAEQLANFGSWQINMVTGELYWSPEIHRIFGYIEGEVEPSFKNFIRIVHPDDVNQLKDNLKTLVGFLDSERQDFRIIDPQGSIKYIRAGVVVKRQEQSKIISMTGFCQDITQKKLDEEELKWSEEKLRISSRNLEKVVSGLNKIMDASLDIICSINEAGNFLNISSACTDLWGYSPEALTGRSFTELVMPEDAMSTEKVLGLIRGGLVVTVFENRFLRIDGGMVPMIWSARWDENDKTMYCVGKNASEKKRQELAFLREQERFTDLFFDAPVMICVFRGPEHVYEMANPLYLREFGKKNIVGRSARSVFPEADDNFFQKLDEVFRSGKSFSAEEMLVKVDKYGTGVLTDVYLNFANHPYKNEDGTMEGIFFFGVNVTEQMQARKRIEESENRYRLIVETAQEGIWLLDAGFATIFVNKKMCELFEYSSAEMMEKDYASLMEEETKDKAIVAITAARKGSSERIEVSFITKTGRRIWANLSISPVFDHAGIFSGVLTMLADITDSKLAREQLMQRELRFQALIENNYDAILLRDRQLLNVYRSPSVTRMLGYPDDERLGRSFEELIHPAERSVIREGNDIVRNNPGKPVHRTFRMKHMEGHYIWVEVITTNMLHDKNVNAIVSNFRDITERKEAEQKREFEQRDKEALINSTEDHIWSINRDLKLVAANSAYLKYIKNITGVLLTRGDDILVRDNVPLAFLNFWEVLYQRALAGEFFRTEYYHPLVDGQPENWSEISFTPTYVGDEVVGLACYSRLITANKQYEKNLKAINQKLETAQQIASLGYWELDMDQRSFYWSDEMYKIWEEAPGSFEVSYNYFFNSIHPDDRSAFETNQKLAMTGEAPLDMEHRIILPGGNIKYVHEKGSLILNESGKPLRFEGTVQDITVRKLAENQLRELSERLTLATTAANVGIFDWDIPGKILNWDRTMFSLYGKLEEVGFAPNFDRWMAGVYAKDRARTISEIEDALSGKKEFDTEFRVVWPDGSTHHIKAFGMVQRDREGNPLRILGTNWDITQRKEAEEALRRSEANLLTIIDNTDTSYVLINRSMKVVSFNQNARKFAKEQLQQDIEEGLDAMECFPIGRQPAVLQALTEVLHGNMIKYDISYKREDGSEKWYEARYFPVRNNDKNILGVILSLTDFTERKKAEEKLIQSEKYNRNLFDQSTVGLALTRMDGSLEDVNEAYAKITGRSITEVRNVTNLGMTPKIYHDQEVTILNELELSGRYGPYEKEYIHKDGHLVPVSMSGTILEKDGERFIWSSVEDITIRKKVEEERRRFIDRFERVSQATNDAIWDWDLTTDEVWWNESFYKLMGYDSNQAVPNLYDWTRKIHPEEQVRIIYRLKRIRQSTESIWEDEFRYMLPEEEYGTVLVRAYVLRDEFKKPIRVIGAMMDITERKKTEHQIAESERRYRTLFEQNLAGVYRSALSGQLLTCNEAFGNMLGYTDQQELLHINASSLYARESDWQDFVANLREHRKLYNYETVLTCRDGRHLYVIQNISLFTDPITGEEICDGVLIDISDRKHAEEALKKSEERYRQIVETAQEGIWLIDEQNQTVFVNKKMCEMLEYPAEELVGKKNYNFNYNSEDVSGLSNGANESQILNGNYDVKYITRSGKHLWTNISTNPILNEEGNYIGALGMVTNITQRKMDEELLKKSEANLEIKNRELEQTNKELEQFAYVASHDLQEPLRTTSSFVKMLQQQYEGKLDKNADKYLTFIVQASDRMKILIKDLLEYSRIGSKKELVQVDCNLVLEDVLADLGQAISETNASITIGNLPVISGYATEIKQLFQNLVINAIKFRKKDIDPEISIFSIEEPDNWHFAVKDNGIGIEEQHKERIFIIFQRLHTRTVYQGSGIGLSNCKKIVELHNGNIWVESRLGEGSIFHFTINKSIHR